jgi:toxin ParE1/3/4
VLSIVLTPSASGDLAEIWEFIAADNPVQADAFIELIDAKFQNPSRHPDAGRRRDELLDGLRSLPVGRSLIFYLQDDVCRRIVRVLHGARDVEAVFADPAEDNQP